MPAAGIVEEVLVIPDGVSVELSSGQIVVRGKGEVLSRALRHPHVEMVLEDGRLKIRSHLPTKREKAIVGTFASHIRNMIKGVTEGFTYKMKIVYSHFPMKVTVKGSEVVIENFLGEKYPRRARIVGKTKVEVKGDTVFISGPNIEDVGQTAANIEQATRIKKKDPRVFQDGIYIVSKGVEA